MKSAHRSRRVTPPHEENSEGGTHAKSREHNEDDTIKPTGYGVHRGDNEGEWANVEWGSALCNRDERDTEGV